MSALTDSAAWRKLQSHAKQLAPDIPGLFAADPDRARQMAIDGAGLHLNFSRQRVTGKTLELLLALARQQALEAWRTKLFTGEPVNNTEQRAALHMALRAPRSARMDVAGRNVMPDVHAVLRRVCAFAEQVRSGRWKGSRGRRITDVVNIGIGGSDLGPRLVCEALDHRATGPRMHFVSNVDGSELDRVLKPLDPRRTLWIITSKTFTTQETMANARAARRWFLKTCTATEIPLHFVAVSTNRPAVEKFGISPDNMFEFWDWVGGRYSLWSAVGLSIAIRLGGAGFRRLLAGAHAMDRHFQSAPLERNLPVLMGLLGVWTSNFLGATSHVLAPYDQRLQRLPAWLQQLEMESNGKSVDRQGGAVDYPTTPVLWGDVGTNAQHAFFQMLHQGTQIHPVDFILTVQPDHRFAELHRLLLANGLAQGAALMAGKDAGQVRAELAARGLQGSALEAAIPPRVFAGNRPSSTLLLPRVDAWHLGALLALFEHRTFVQGVIWNLNPFDQWGVELGKQLAGGILAAMGGADADVDLATRALLKKLRRR